jgi:hypothetical protein
VGGESQDDAFGLMCVSCSSGAKICCVDQDLCIARMEVLNCFACPSSASS